MNSSHQSNRARGIAKVVKNLCILFPCIFLVLAAFTQPASMLSWEPLEAFFGPFQGNGREIAGFHRIFYIQRSAKVLVRGLVKFVPAS